MNLTMQKKNKHPDLFDGSGNLTLRAIDRYLRDQLTAGERRIVQARLDESPFEREALEGYRIASIQDPDRDVSQLNLEILSAGRAGRQQPGRVAKTRFYLAAAASVAAVAIITSVLYFSLWEKQHPVELALITEDTTGHAIGGVKSGDAKSAELPGSVTESPQNEEIPEQMAVADEPGPGVDIPGEQKALLQKEPNLLVEEGTPPASPESRVNPVITAELDMDEVTADFGDSFVVVPPSGLPDFSEKITGVSAAEDSERRTAMHRTEIEGDKSVAVARPSAPDSISGSDPVFLSVSEMPTYPGGDSALIKFISENAVYPPQALENDIAGRVFVRFIVEKDGSVTGMEVLRGIGYGCNEEAMRVVGMMRWNPGRQNGTAVRVLMNLPVMFTLPNNE